MEKAVDQTHFSGRHEKCSLHGNRIASFPGKSRTNESLKGPTVVEILYAKIRKQCVYVGIYYRDHICIVGNQPQELQILHTLEVCIGPLVRVSSIRNCDHMMKIQTVVRVFSTLTSKRTWRG